MNLNNVIMTFSVDNCVLLFIMAPKIKKPMQDRVKSAFIKPGHPIAFSAPGAVSKHFGISKKRAKQYLQSIDAYTLHREYKKPRVFNPFYVHKRREQVQADLIEIGQIAKENDGVRYLLLLIDIFTKWIWIYPLKTKKGQEVSGVMKDWLQSLQDVPKILLTDRGTEFMNQQVQQLLRRFNVEWQAGKGMTKAAIAERANKTIQIIIYKYFTQTETLRYIDKLQLFVKTYNTRPHRTLQGMTPQEADKKRNEKRVQAIYHEKYSKIQEKANQVPRFKVGEMVRVKTESRRISSGRRAYAEQFHGEFYRIIRINRTVAVPMYYLRAIDDGEYIEGAFYGEELQKVSGDIWKIEKVLRERVRRGIPEIYVKWQYFSDQWNEWIPKTNVERVF